jgi:hypothetical protein
LFVLATGCANSNTSTPVASHTPAQKLTPVAITTPTVTILSAPTASIAPSTSTPVVVEGKQCLNIGEQEARLQDIATGTVLLGRTMGPLYLLELKSQTRYEVPVVTGTSQHYFYGIHTSPDKNYLAYVDGYAGGEKWDKLNLWVVDAKGSLKANKSLRLDILTSGWHWLDNERIQILFGQAALDGTVYIYEPFAHKGNNITITLPNFYKDYSLRASNWLVEYSPDMKKVIYLGYPEDVGIGPILLDLSMQNVLWKGSGFLATTNQPVWSPNNDAIALIFNRHLYIINTDGIAKSLSVLGKNDEVTEFAWSPDGRYISFWVVYNQGVKANLMLYDVQTEQVVDYCVSSFVRERLITWSPDSKQFVTSVEAEKADLSLDEFSLLVDVDNSVGFRISGDMEPIEWMNSLP